MDTPQVDGFSERKMHRITPRQVNLAVNPAAGLESFSADPPNVQPLTLPTGHTKSGRSEGGGTQGLATPVGIYRTGKSLKEAIGVATTKGHHEFGLRMRSSDGKSIFESGRTHTNGTLSRKRLTHRAACTHKADIRSWCGGELG